MAFIKNILILCENRLHKSDLAYRFFHGAFWSILGAIIGRGLVLVSFILVARIIGKHAYGELGIIRSTINMFIIFASMGIGLTASKYISQYRNRDISKVMDVYVLLNYVSIILGLLFVILLSVFSHQIAEFSLHAPELSDEIKLGAIVLFFTTINGAQNGVLSGFEDFKSIALNTLYSGVIQSVCLLIGCFLWGVSGGIIALGVGCFFLYLFNRISISNLLKKHGISFKWKQIQKKTLIILWKFSLPSVLSSIMIVPVLWWSKTYLIAHTGYGEMANYDVAEQWSTMVLFIPSTLSQIILPLLSNTLEEGSERQYMKLIKVNLCINIFVSCIISLIVILGAKFILELYGNEYANDNALIYMMIASVIMSACNVVGQVIASQDKMWLGFLFNFIWASLVISFTVMFVGHGYGAKGLALAILCSYAIHFLGQLIYVLIILKK